MWMRRYGSRTAFCTFCFCEGFSTSAYMLAMMRCGEVMELDELMRLAKRSI